jgi:hypothetical protein
MNKTVKLLEWGEGTTTLNQNWHEVGEGRILSAKQKDCITTLVVELKGNLAQASSKDKEVKIVQKGEGMTACSDSYGEVAIGKLTAIDNTGTKARATVVVDVASKIDRRG